MVGGENRRRSIVKALRKRRIAKSVYPSDSDWEYYSNLHQYSKGKIHCSCPLCSAKTRNKGHSKLKGMLPGVNYTISDTRKIQRLEYDDFNDGE